jgi:8-oxo-dGTP diphosphatase
MGPDGGPGLAEIRAAGAVLWQPAPGGPVVALVHRPRYDDWSLPKGKTQAGEHVLLTAVREVAEETGVRVVLGRRLPSTHYETNGGRPKVVDYWAARAAAGPQPGFTPNAEVDQVDWLPVPAARERLSYPHDGRVLDDFAAGPLDTVPVVLLRHASAVHKMDWQVTGHDDDLKRPLDPAGGQQAQALAPLLCCFAPGWVVSSVADRCQATVRPYAALAGVPVQADPALTVGLSAEAATRRRVAEIVGSQRSAVVCGHRENLPLILEEACAVLGAKLPEDRVLPLAGFWVLHAAGHALASAERHHLESG